MSLSHLELVHENASPGAPISPLPTTSQGLLGIPACREYLAEKYEVFPTEASEIHQLVRALNKIAWDTLTLKEKRRFFRSFGSSISDNSDEREVPFIANPRMLPMASTADQAHVAADIAQFYTVGVDGEAHPSDYFVVDLFAGSGINAQQFALNGFTVLACEVDDCKRDILRHNLKVTGVLAKDSPEAGKVYVVSEDASAFVQKCTLPKDKSFAFIDAPWDMSASKGKSKKGRKTEPETEDSRWGFKVEGKVDVSLESYGCFSKIMFKVSKDNQYTPFGFASRLDSFHLKCVRGNSLYQIRVVQTDQIKYLDPVYAENIEKTRFERAQYKLILQKWSGKKSFFSQRKSQSNGNGRGNRGRGNANRGNTGKRGNNRGQNARFQKNK
jgi:hypothetical protein